MTDKLRVTPAGLCILTITGLNLAILVFLLTYVIEEFSR